MPNTFDACMQRTTDGQPPKSDSSNWLILVSDMRMARQDLRVAWLAARRAEYEYTVRLSANDILKFLQDLDAAVTNLPGKQRWFE